MSIFLCIKCGDLKDSDDGCAEAPYPKYSRPHQLLCVDCMQEDEEEDGPPREFSAEQQASIDRWEAEADDDGP